MTRHVLGIIAGIALFALAIVLLLEAARERSRPSACAWRCDDAVEMETAAGELFCSCADQRQSGWAAPEATVVATRSDER